MCREYVVRKTTDDSVIYAGEIDILDRTFMQSHLTPADRQNGLSEMSAETAVELDDIEMIALVQGPNQTALKTPVPGPTSSQRR